MDPADDYDTYMQAREEFSRRFMPEEKLFGDPQDLPPKADKRLTRMMRALCQALGDGEEADESRRALAALLQKHSDQILVNLVVRSGTFEGATLLAQLLLAGRAAASAERVLLLLDLLVQHGAGVNVRTPRSSDTPLILAAMYSPVAVVRALLRLGARPDACDWSGHTALCRAKEPNAAWLRRSDSERAELVELLAEAEAAARASPAAAEAAALRERGNDAFRAGDYEGAARLYTRSLEAFEADDRTFSNRAACSLKIATALESGGEMGYLRMYKFARADAYRATRLQPTNRKAWYRAARGQIGARDLPRAQLALKNGLEHCPGDPDLSALAKRLMEFGIRPPTFSACFANKFSGDSARALAAVKAGAPSFKCTYCAMPIPGRHFVPATGGDCCPHCACPAQPLTQKQQQELEALRVS